MSKDLKDRDWRKRTHPLSLFTFDFRVSSVGRTLNFALNTKTPGKLLPNETKASFKKQTLETLLKMLGISHTIDTLVGS